MRRELKAKVDSLESLRSLRENRLSVAKKEMNEIKARLETQVIHKNKSQGERSALVEKLSSLTSFASMQLDADLVGSESRRMQQLSDKIIDIEKELERHQEWVTHLGRELRIVERLQEKYRSQLGALIARQEKKSLDAWVVERWAQPTAMSLEKALEKTLKGGEQT